MRDLHAHLSDHHRCDACGCRLADHKGGDDKNGPSNRCPKTSSWGNPAPMQFGKKSEASIDKMLRHYWSSKKTTFKEA